jgi:hypothetical protein
VNIVITSLKCYIRPVELILSYVGNETTPLGQQASSANRNVAVHFVTPCLCISDWAVGGIVWLLRTVILICRSNIYVQITVYAYYIFYAYIRGRTLRVKPLPDPPAALDNCTVCEGSYYQIFLCVLHCFCSINRNTAKLLRGWLWNKLIDIQGMYIN